MRILHVFRTPVGGLFRHVRDLLRGQTEAGHEVGIICDAATGPAEAAPVMQAVAENCMLGLKRISIPRLPGFGDMAAIDQAKEYAAEIRPDIIHCHGAKGGLLGRMAAHGLSVPAIYTPHGGSLHYGWSSPTGFAYLSAEKLLLRQTNALHFVCNFERDQFDAKIGLRGMTHAVIHNGLWPEEFEPVATAHDAADVIFIGEMRHLKGVDVLIEALALCNRQRLVTAILGGDGADLPALRALASERGIANRIRFPGNVNARAAMAMGRTMVVPSRAESFPYIVLEASAAGRPVIASAVGGIGEMLPPEALVPANDPQRLADRLLEGLSNLPSLEALVLRTRENIAQRFTAPRMVAQVMQLYDTVIRHKF